MSTWHWAEDYEGRTCTVSTVSPGVRTGVRVICLVDATRPTPDAKKLVDETAQQSRKEINIAWGPGTATGWIWVYGIWMYLV